MPSKSLKDIEEGGFGISRVAGLANFGHWVFSEKVARCRVLAATSVIGFAIFGLGFRVL